MIEQTIENWHRQLKGELPGGLDALLADDVVFYSPVVFTPQKGVEITKAYLNAAYNTFGDAEGEASERAAGDGESKGFRYTKKILSGNSAMLEFETEMDG
jgi:hypothetical protein